jgi:hypothetical protein
MEVKHEHQADVRETQEGGEVVEEDMKEDCVGPNVAVLPTRENEAKEVGEGTLDEATHMMVEDYQNDPSTGSKRKNLRVSNACYRPRKTRCTRDGKASSDKPDSNEVQLATVSHLFILYSAISDVTPCPQICSACDCPNQSTIKCTYKECTVSMCFGLQPGNCLLPIADHQTAVLANNWLCPDHEVTNSYGGKPLPHPVN